MVIMSLNSKCAEWTAKWTETLIQLYNSGLVRTQVGFAQPQKLKSEKWVQNGLNKS